MTEQSGSGSGGKKKRKEVSFEDVGCLVVVGSSLAFIFLAFLFCYVVLCYLCLVSEKKEESESKDMRKMKDFSVFTGRFKLN